MDRFLIVKPKEDYRLFGTGIQVTKGDRYAVIPALNQPDNENKIFLLHDPSGGSQISYYDVEYCMGFLLNKDDVEIINDDADCDDLRCEEILFDDAEY